MPIDWNAFTKDVVNAAVISLVRSGQQVSRRAKAKAPVRNILEGAEVRHRSLSIAEVESARSIRISLGIPIDTLPKQTLRSTNRVYRLMKIRAIRTLEENEDLLTSAGRSELKSGRANYKDRVGGRLKGEIYATGATRDGSVIKVQVISPTPYARFQELGSRHNAAHPFLRPALEESREEIRDGLIKATSEAAAASAAAMSGSLGTVRIKLKAEVS